MIKNISNLGDAALYCDFGKEVNIETNYQVINFYKNIKRLKILGITNMVPSYNKLIITFNLSQTTYKEIKEKILKIKLKKFENNINKIIKIPVCCDKEFALDSERLTKKLKISFDKILNLYFEKEYFCYMTGFIAGMPFLGDINVKLRSKRLETPRVKVPKGSIGLTEQFCNIYTYDSPGGWNIIGNTPIKIFNKADENSPTLINAGDKVLFYKISMKDFLSWNE